MLLRIVRSFVWFAIITIILVIAKWGAKWGNIAAEVAEEFKFISEGALRYAQEHAESADIVLNDYYNENLSDRGRLRCGHILARARNSTIDCIRQMYIADDDDVLLPCLSEVVIRDLTDMMTINAEDRNQQNGAGRLNSLIAFC